MVFFRNGNRIIGAVVTFAVIIAVAACINMPSYAINKTITDYESRVTLGRSSNTEAYLRKPQKPNIFLDEVGYIPRAKKVFYIQRDDLLKDFEILDMNTNEIVFNGELERLEGREDGTILYLGDFTDFNTEGTFRIYQKDVGYSNEFLIEEGLYDRIYLDVQQLISRHVFITEEDRLYAAALILLTEEIYGSEKIDEALLLDTVTSLLEDGHERNANQSLLTAGLFAQYAFNHREESIYDEAVRQADRLYDDAMDEGGDLDPDTMYYAAAELYRILGTPKYSRVIVDIDREALNYNKEYNLSILADVAYLKTKFKTDYELCETIFKSYVTAAESISNKSGKLYYYVQKDIESLEKNQILDNMLILGLVSYVLSSHEYLSIQGNYIHYIFGCNSLHANHYDEVMNKKVKDDYDIVDMCKLLFVLINGGVRA